MINIYIWANRNNKGYKKRIISFEPNTEVIPKDFLNKILYFDMDNLQKKFAYGKVPDSNNFFVFFSKIENRDENSSIDASFAIEFSNDKEYQSFANNFSNKFLHKNDNNTELIESFKDIIISSEKKGELELNLDKLNKFITQMIKQNLTKKYPTNSIEMIICSKNDKSEKILDFFGNNCIRKKSNDIENEQVTYYLTLDEQIIKKKVIIQIIILILVALVLIVGVLIPLLGIVPENTPENTMTLIVYLLRIQLQIIWLRL